MQECLVLHDPCKLRCQMAVAMLILNTLCLQVAASRLGSFSINLSSMFCRKGQGYVCTAAQQPGCSALCCWRYADTHLHNGNVHLYLDHSGQLDHHGFLLLPSTFGQLLVQQWLLRAPCCCCCCPAGAAAVQGHLRGQAGQADQPDQGRLPARCT